ncbi:Hypothetical_protein [Hexamita inflata]|uniref:Hypothetical_protein n=1 Tax=Hexamita inflata TaxID=28002 RepID=A0AA86R1E8_9EUKA|nr:Hypothetical protein HINF_LOCUS51489 [Hexamita inflata]
MKDQVQKMNNTLNLQIQQTVVYLMQNITNLNQSNQLQFDTQKQQMNSISLNINNINSQLTSTINSINRNLQTQIDGIKNDMKNVQSSITGITGYINNINNINQIQNNDIQALKSKATSNLSGPLWCKIAKNNEIIFQVSGYCPLMAQCCRPVSNYYHCHVYGDSYLYATAQTCGKFEPF